MYYGAHYYHPALGRFVSADTIVPNPGNPQDLNRYAYVRNNPLRYVDPTGYFSEEEIMRYFGVETWEAVLAFFEAGGALEGRWGWLEVLRRAEFEDEISFWNEHRDNIYSRSEDAPIFAGTFVESAGGHLVIKGTFYGSVSGWEGLETVVRQIEAALFGNFYILEHSTAMGKMTNAIDADQMFQHIDLNKVDWAGAALDIGGIIADVFTLGIAGRLGNAAKIARAGGEFVGTGISLVDIAYGGAQVARDGEVTGEDMLSLTTDVAGLWIPIGPDVFGLYLNFSQACSP